MSYVGERNERRRGVLQRLAYGKQVWYTLALIFLPCGSCGLHVHLFLPSMPLARISLTLGTRINRKYRYLIHIYMASSANSFSGGH